MADTIGLALDSDTLVLTRGRDFKWLFENQDTSGNPVDYPAGELYFELDTRGEHNALQQVEVTASNGGAYKLGHQGNWTSNILYYDANLDPNSLAGDIRDVLEALPSIGPGNVLVHPAQLTPVWELSLTLDAGHNEVQLISFTNPPASGTWKLGLGTAATTLLPFNATAAQVKTALEGIAAIGTGNVSVTGDMTNGFRVEFIGAKANTNMGQLVGLSAGTNPSASSGADWFFGLFGAFLGGLGGQPQQQQQKASSVVKVTTLIQGQPRFNQALVDTVTNTINAYFGSFGSLSGVTTEFIIHNNLSAKIKVTSLKSFDEIGQITFGVDVTSTDIQGVFSNVAALGGVFDTVTVDFYWNFLYQIEFVGDLANTFQAELGVDKTGLTGVNSEQDVQVTVLKPGLSRYTKWPFVIDGSLANLKVESEAADEINPRTPWQLVFLPQGEQKGGDPIARGKVVVQE